MKHEHKFDRPIDETHPGSPRLCICGAAPPELPKAPSLRDLVVTYFKAMDHVGNVRWECSSDDPDLCTSSRCREGQRDAQEAAGAAEKALRAAIA